MEPLAKVGRRGQKGDESDHVEGDRRRRGEQGLQREPLAQACAGEQL